MTMETHCKVSGRRPLVISASVSHAARAAPPAVLQPWFWAPGPGRHAVILLHRITVQRKDVVWGAPKTVRGTLRGGLVRHKGSSFLSDLGFWENQEPCPSAPRSAHCFSGCWACNVLTVSPPAALPSLYPSPPRPQH